MEKKTQSLLKENEKNELTRLNAIFEVSVFENFKGKVEKKLI